MKAIHTGSMYQIYDDGLETFNKLPPQCYVIRFSQNCGFYNKLVFAIFLLGSILYDAWMTLFLKRRKVLDYDLFEQEAINNNKTYEFTHPCPERGECADDGRLGAGCLGAVCRHVRRYMFRGYTGCL